MSERSKIVLKNGKEEAVKRFHPWIFSGAIKTIYGDVAEGDIVEVYSVSKEFLALGHYQIGSISVRLFSFDNVEPDTDFWRAKLQKAYNLRIQLGLTDNPETNAYRLVHAEGDGMPGLIIDFYNGVAVLQTHSIGMHYLKPVFVDLLKELYGEKLIAVYDKSADSLPKKAEVTSIDGYLWGNASETIVKEYGNKFFVDCETGQKTGFFIDQRENRKLIEKYCKDKVVLNTFCYSGGFSVYALKAGAREVHSLDSSKKAIELTDKNIELNGIEPSKHRSIVADAVEHIKGVSGTYDLIILDPPAFAKHNDVRHNAVQAYKRLNAYAIQNIRPGGIIFTFSCSQVVDRFMFEKTVNAAAIESKREVKILHHLSQSPDHPVSAFHPEGEYLKGLVLQVV
jgi:23S rRNA (cytosine1962-C5)-methyltransferase